MSSALCWNVLCAFLLPYKTQIDSGKCEAWAEQLKRVSFKNIDTVRVCVAEGVAARDQPRVLHASLAVISALTCEPRHLSVEGLTVTSGECAAQ